MMYNEFESAFMTAHAKTAEFAAKTLGEEYLFGAVRNAHENWEKGTRWAFENPIDEMLNCFETRTAENENKELAACLNKAAEKLDAEAKRAYIQSIPREEMLSMLNSVVTDPNNIDGMVNTEIGEMYYITLMEIWNKGNEGNEIHYAPDFSI